MGKRKRLFVEESRYTKVKSFVQDWCSKRGLKQLTFNSDYLHVVFTCLLFIEIVLNVIIIRTVPYTEIDWKAYMQEVEGFINGTWDYTELQGDTGPLVYPAGFVYIFSGLYYLTDHGRDIYFAQCIFAIIYIFNLSLVFNLYRKAKNIPPYAAVFLCFPAYRIHSIYVLRLFNDPVAMCLLYLALNLFIYQKWTLGSIFFSLSVSVKMNILLYAPALLLVYVRSLGIIQTITQLSICAAIQLMLASPFLWQNPLGYIGRAFDLGRVFLYQWTVNWRCLPEEIFLDPRFHALLLVGHLLALLLFGYVYRNMYAFGKCKQCLSQPRPVLLLLFTCNMLGVAFSRSLHYQFYVWYYHTLPFLLWSTSYAPSTKLCLLGIIEICWNTYPSTELSSLALHLCHLSILWGLLRIKTKME